MKTGVTENNFQETEEVFKKLEQGIKNVYNSDKYKEYLRFMSKFPSYSINNLLFLQFQCISRGVTPKMFAGFTTWKKLGIRVKKGEKAFSVLAPIKKKVLVAKDDELTPNDESSDVSGNTQFVEKIMGFRVINRTFELSQTDGKDKIPQLLTDLQGVVEKREEILLALEEVTNIKFAYENIQSGAKGYFNKVKNKIALQKDMSDLQTIKTAIHESAHALLHGEYGIAKEAERHEKEIQAESVAFVVSNYLGLSTDEYSFPYVADWGMGKGVELLRENLDLIRETSLNIITKISEKAELVDGIDKLAENELTQHQGMTL